MDATPDLNAETAAWRSLLDEAGARLEGDRVTGLPPTRVEDNRGARLTPLLNRAWLSLAGTDARRFLHDQLTAGVSDIPDLETRLAAYCSPQGRVMAVLRVSGEAEGLRVELPGALADSIARRLRMFVLRADVQIEHAGDLTALGCWGEAAPDLLASLGLPVPEESFRPAHHRQASVTRLPAPTPRFQLTGPPATVTGAWRQWRAEAPPADSADWQYLDILAGLPDIGPETADQFLPQSLGLAHWRAVSLKKGCYPGQEVIARAHYRGRLKRHLYRARTEGPPPGAGSPVLDERDGHAGSVINAAPAPDGGSALLAVLHERFETGYRLAADNGATLRDLERVAA